MLDISLQDQFRPVKAMLPFSYYEHKYLVLHKNLLSVRRILDSFLGSSDPYPQGTVDSIYYDTKQQRLLSQCIEGVGEKFKFRIRGYGNASYLQVHEKIKNLSGVSKHKAKLNRGCIYHNKAPTWNEVLCFLSAHDKMHFSYLSSSFQSLFPSVRINYHRYRYRRFDYRLTLDTNIEAFRLSNGLPHRQAYVRLPWHVLEIKTKEEFPSLPFWGLVEAKKVSFSKFMLGVNLLNDCHM